MLLGYLLTFPLKKNRICSGKDKVFYQTSLKKSPSTYYVEIFKIINVYYLNKSQKFIKKII